MIAPNACSSPEPIIGRQRRKEICVAPILYRILTCYVGRGIELEVPVTKLESWN